MTLAEAIAIGTRLKFHGERRVTSRRNTVWMRGDVIALGNKRLRRKFAA